MTAAAGHPVDQLMERASAELVSTHYFEAEALCVKALEKAAHANDFERMARICLPLQEARRQKREEALDTGRTFILRELPARRAALEAGCYLLEPPLIGIEAQTLRAMLDRKKVPAMVLCREPMTSAGKWPIVGVSGADRESVSVRVQVAPPGGFELAHAGDADLRAGPSGSWFIETQEALGDAAIAKVSVSLPADYKALDLMEYLRAVPDHEKLHQALMNACMLASKGPLSEKPRRRAVIEDPWGF